MSTSETDAGAGLRCAAHPGSVTYLRCAQCGTPICPRCLVMTPVGAKCRACAQVRLQPGFTLTPLDIVLAVVVSVFGGLILGVIGSVIVRAVPLVTILFPFAVGMALSAAINRLLPRKHGIVLKVIAAIGVVLSFLVLGVGDFFLMGPLDFVESGLLGPFVVRELINLVINPFNALFLIIGIWVVVYRID